MKKNILLSTIILFVSFNLHAQSNVELKLIPQPLSVNYKGQSITLSGSDLLDDFVLLSNDDDLLDDAEFLFSKFIGRKELKENDFSRSDAKIIISLEIDKSYKENDEAYSITMVEKNKQWEIKITGCTNKAIIYGLATVSQLITNENSKTILRISQIEDQPFVSNRMIVANMEHSDYEDLLLFAIENKISCIALNSRAYNWYGEDDNYSDLIDKTDDAEILTKYVEFLNTFNLYQGREFIYSDENNYNSLMEKLSDGYEVGINKIMIAADDLNPWNYKDGYILTNENDKKKYSNLAEAQSELLNRIKNEFVKNGKFVELYFVPPFYTYEDIFYGDIRMYKNTFWEDDAYQPFQNYLSTLSKNLDTDIEIIWTGPDVRSREINNDDLATWTKLLNNRTPFLWDNTIYSHDPYSNSDFFTAYKNKFSAKVLNHLKIKGIYINGNMSDSLNRYSYLTINDYLWNPKAYNSNQSINRAYAKYFSEKTVSQLWYYKENELSFRKTKGDYDLWNYADTLWQAIRSVKKTHTKNPLRFHFNYSGMKSLRMQLKLSSINRPTKAKLELKFKHYRIQRDLILRYFKENKFEWIYNKLRRNKIDLCF